MAPHSLRAFTALAIDHGSGRQSKDLFSDDIEPNIQRERREHGLAKVTDASGSQYDLHSIPAAHLSDISRRPPAERDSNSKDVYAMEYLGSSRSGDKTQVRAAVASSSVHSLNVIPVNTELQTDNQGERKLTPQQKRIGLIQFIAVCWCIFLVGWNDGSTGPLLPRIQEQYHLGFTVVSMIFVSSCFGYVSAAALNIWLTDKIGFGKIITLGALCQLVGYLIIIPAPPYPVLVCSYVIIGFGLSLQAAQANGYVGSLQHNMTLKMGIEQATYGLGAFLSPFSSTYFATFVNRRWAFHFIISSGLALSNVALLLWVFRFKRQDEAQTEAGEIHPSSLESDSANANAGGNKYQQILRIKSVHLMTLFTLIYVGVEVTLGGWIVTFIIHERQGGPDAGYISAGFFGGLTLGRVCLMWLNKMVGERRVIFLYSALAIGLEFTVWFVPSIIGNAVAIAIIGLLLGPMFPLLVQHMARILPRWLLTGCVGIVAGVGIAGSAALPFLTGLLASRYGISALQPLMISMMCVMVAAWAFVPSAKKTVE